MRLYVNGEFAATLVNVRESSEGYLAGDFASHEFRKEIADEIQSREDSGSIELDVWVIEEPDGATREVKIGYLDFSTGALVWRYR